MKILILHDLLPLTQIRRQTINQSFFFLKYRTGVDPVLHAYGDPIDDDLRNGDYDAIFLDASFLCWRWALPKHYVEAIEADYAWLAEHPAPKLAFPQDDYDRHAILDDWMVRWRVDTVFSPLRAFADVLYPRASTTATIRPFFTGFVDDVDLALANRRSLPISERPLDIAYRARPLPANFGELGQLKTRIAEAFLPVCEKLGLQHDISIDPNRTVFGDAWLDFLGSARYVLGTPSGSSVLDPHGEIAEGVAAYLADQPQASFAEISRACLPEEATRYNMEAISPRIFETALARSCQILIHGDYGPLEPGTHYIPVARDLSDIDEVAAGLGDHARAQRIADACHDLVRNSLSLHYRQAAADVEAAIAEAWSKRYHGSRRLPALRDASADESQQTELLLCAALRDRQRLVRSFGNELGRRTTGETMEISRMSEITYVLGHRWDRLAEHAAKGWKIAAEIPAPIAQSRDFITFEDASFKLLLSLGKKRILRRLRGG